MSSDRAGFALRVGLSAGTAVLIMLGASLNASGRAGWSTGLAGVAGLLALAAGIVYRQWRLVVPAAGAALVLTALIVQLNPNQGDLLLQLSGMVVLGVAGATGVMAFRSFADALRRRAEELHGVTSQLEQKHRAFLAATSDANGARPDDMAALTASIAGQVGADFACCYLVSADGRRYVPQPPGLGVERLRPQAVNRMHGDPGRLLATIEAGNAFMAENEDGLGELISYVPDDFHLASLLAVPMPIGEHVGGFVVLGRKAGTFTDDDRRLGGTLAVRAGGHLASAHLVALTRHESARYSLMNELVKEASGKTMNEVLELVLARGVEMIRYETGRAILFQPGDTYVGLHESAPAEPVDAVLARVREGETTLRNLVTEEEGIYSGLQPERLGATVNEALTPIRGNGRSALTSHG